jgi:hypothetical protein
VAARRRDPMGPDLRRCPARRSRGRRQLRLGASAGGEARSLRPGGTPGWGRARWVLAFGDSLGAAGFSTPDGGSDRGSRRRRLTAALQGEGRVRRSALMTLAVVVPSQLGRGSQLLTTPSGCHCGTTASIMPGAGPRVQT